jgi:hypothetical protein
MTDRRDYLALSLLVLLILGFAGEMVWADKIPFFRDLGLYFYPIRFSVAHSFNAGELPLWDRHMAMGYPLLADFQSGAFYPPSLVYRLLPFFAAIRATFILHYLVAGTGAYLLFRSWGYPMSLAIIAGILFTLGGTMISLTNLLNHFQAAVWLPWVVYFAHQFMREPSWKKFLLLTGILTVQFLAGSPEVYIMTQGLVLFYAVCVAERVGAAGRFFLTLAGANLVVAGISMAQILPTLELLRESRARAPLTLDEATSWSLRPVHLLNFFFIDKEIDPTSYTSPKLFFSNKTPLMISYYMGAIAPVGVLLWAYYASLKERILVVAFLVFSLALAMGSHTPLYSLFFSYVPVFRIFRFPEKFVFLTYALALFAALRGLRAFLESEVDWRRALFAPLLVGLVGLLAYAYLRWDPAPLTRFIEASIENTVGQAWTVKRIALVFFQFETALILFFGTLTLLLLKKLGKLRPSLFTGLLLTVVFIDLYAAHRSYQFLFSPDVYENAKVLDRPDAEPNRIFYFPGPGNLHPSYFALPKELGLPDFHAVVYANLLPNSGVLAGFDYMQEIDALGRWPYLEFLWVANKLEPRRLYSLLGSLNVRYVTAFKALPTPTDGVTLVRQSPETSSWLYTIDRAAPRAYIVANAIAEKKPDDVLLRLANPGFDPTSEVVLNEPQQLESNAQFKASAKITRYENMRVNINAALDGPGILVLADSYYPGWRVFIDGREGEILRANLFFRGVKLAAGEHAVEFRYEPRSFQIGAWASLATMGVLALVTATISLRTRRRRPLGSSQAPSGTA